MGQMMTADEVYKRIEAAAVAATNPDERALQVDYNAIKSNVHTALGDRKVAFIHVNRFLPEGYEEQGRLNVLVLTAGAVLFDMVVGDSYFRYDVVSAAALDKVQLIDAVWENREKRREEPFMSLRLMHGDEAHILLALDPEERNSLQAFAQAVSIGRSPERSGAGHP
jgi:hypothetical protein